MVRIVQLARLDGGKCTMTIYVLFLDEIHVVPGTGGRPVETITGTDVAVGTARLDGGILAIAPRQALPV